MHVCSVPHMRKSQSFDWRAVSSLHRLQHAMWASLRLVCDHPAGARRVPAPGGNARDSYKIEHTADIDMRSMCVAASPCVFPVLRRFSGLPDAIYPVILCVRT